MRKLTLLLIFLVLIPSLNAICCEKNKDCVISETCQDAACGNCSIIVYNRSGTTMISRTSMEVVNPYLYTYNASTNLSNYGTYPYAINCTNDKICQGVCQVEVVQECEGENEEFYLYIVSFVIFAILVYLGYHYGIGIFVMIAGMLATIIGIVIYIYGFPNLTNDFLKYSIAIIIWGVGAYFILAPALEYFKELRE